MTSSAAAVISAFVDSSVATIASCARVPARAAAVGAVSGAVSATGSRARIELAGSLSGTITLILSDQLAAECAAGMGCGDLNLDAEMLRLVAAEVANVACGAATGPLYAAGHRVEMTPPLVLTAGHMLPLAERSVAVLVTTAYGPATVIIDLKEIA